MCIVVINREKENLLLAFNRDEKYNKLWRGPSNYWDEDPNIIGYQDITTLGSWLVYNKYGIICCLLNKEMDCTMQTASRGQVVINIIKNAYNITDCLYNWKQLSVKHISPFNIILVCKNELYYCSNRDDKGNICKVCRRINNNLIMLNRSIPNDMNETRIRNNFHRLNKLSNNNISQWINIMSETTFTIDTKTETKMSLYSSSWATICRTIIKLNYNNTIQLECFTY